MTPASLRPPTEDPAALESAARGSRDGAEVLRSVERRTAEAVRIATLRWEGRRRETFVRAAAGVGVLLHAQVVAATEVAELCEEYAALVRRTADEVDDCARRYRGEQEAAAWAREQRDRLVAMGDPILTRGLESDHEDDARAAERRAQLHLDTAVEAHRRLERGASQIADAIHGVTARVPDVASLAGDGRGGRLSGLLRPQVSVTPVLDALLLAVIAGSIVPPSPVPKPGTDPGEVAGWWHLLGPDEQAELLATQPRALGNLDGLPGQVRDRANRACLEGYRQELTAMLAEAEGDEADRLKAKLRGLDKLEEVLDREDRHLLLLDPFSGQQLHAAVAVGDVDNARHVGVFVPGFTTTVRRSLSGYDEDMRRLRDTATRLSKKFGDGGAVSTVSWLGYDAPQWSELADPDRSVLSPRLAQAGGESLAGFLRGLDEMRSDDPHLTPLVHSYGSVVAGYALRHRDLGVDDVVMFGNPGTSVGSRDDLEIPQGHFYAAESVDDWVPDGDVVTPLGKSVRALDGIQFLETGGSHGPLGDAHGVRGHKRYLEQGSTSQLNLAAVTVGLDDRYIVDDDPLSGMSHELVRESVEWGEARARDVGRSLQSLAQSPIPGR